MKVIVDYDVCASTGSCMQVCPEVFEVRSDGFLYVLQEEPPEELREQGAPGRGALPDRRDHRRGLSATVGWHARLAAAWATSGSMLCVGLDPDPARMPASFAGAADGIERFCRSIVDATADLVCAFKPQIAHFAANRAEPQLEAVCTLRPRALPGRRARARRQAGRHRVDGRAVRPRGVRPLRRRRGHRQPVPRHRRRRSVPRARRRARRVPHEQSRQWRAAGPAGRRDPAVPAGRPHGRRAVGAAR